MDRRLILEHLKDWRELIKEDLTWYLEQDAQDSSSDLYTEYHQAMGKFDILDMMIEDIQYNKHIKRNGVNI